MSQLTLQQERAYEHLCEAGSCTVECMASRLKLERYTARNLLLQLERKGLVRHSLHKRVSNTQKRAHLERYAIYKPRWP